uniref:hypothetical protein n=1 Tax=Leptobacterium meishanense TaxID=3128904 RepID=UPI0030EF375C
MRRLLYTVVSLLTAIGIYGQDPPPGTEEISFFISATANGFDFTDTPTGTLEQRSTQFPGYVTSHSLSDVVVNDIIISSTGALYQITSISDPGGPRTVTTSKLTNVVDGTISNLANGVVNIARPTGNCLLIPDYVVNNNGITPLLRAAINNYNLNRLDNCINTAIGGITADNGLTLTGGNIQLGGAMTEPTTAIDLGANTLNYNVDGTGNLNIDLTSTGGFNVTSGANRLLFVQPDGSIGIGAATPIDDSSVLDISQVTDKGVLLPNVAL